MVSQMKETLKLNVLVIWTWSIFGSPQKNNRLLVVVIFHLLPKTRGLWAFVYSLTPHCYIDLPAAWQAAIIDFEITFQPWICVPLLDHAINHLENSHGCWCDHSRCSHFNVINDGPLVCATYMYHNLPASPYCWIFKRQEIKGRASSPSKNKMDDLGVAFFKKSHSYHVDIARIIPCLRIVRRLSEQNNLQASFRTPPEKKGIGCESHLPHPSFVFLGTHLLGHIWKNR